MAKQTPSGYIEKNGYLVTVADAVLMESDLRLFGTLYMEAIGCGYARRIAPSDIYVFVGTQKPDGDSSCARKEET